MQVSELIEHLKTLPQDAEVYVADGETYRLKEHYPDWDEEQNTYFPLEFVDVLKGRSAKEIGEAFLRVNEERARKGWGHVTNPEALPDSVDEPAVLVTLVGER